MANREAATRLGVKWLKKMDPSGNSAKEFQKMVEKLDDEQFEQYVEQIEAGKAFVPLIYENMSGSPITTKGLMKVAEEMGVEVFQHLVTTDGVTGQLMKTPRRYPVLYLPVRRPVQALSKKWSIPDNSSHIDELTDQVTGDSKGSALSFPETLILQSHGQDMAIQEFLKLRGGDLEAQTAMERQIAETGECDATQIVEEHTKPKAVHSLSVFLRTMHLDNTL